MISKLASQTKFIYGNISPAVLILGNGCANTGRTEKLLSAAGFRIFIATTPQQQQHLQTLPNDTITAVSRDGNVYYLFADPAHN